jgi:hypothetical protein
MDVVELRGKLSEAIRHFWKTRTSQAERQGSKTGEKDAGKRGAVTGGKHLDGFIDLVSAVLTKNGIQDGTIYRRKRVELPGFFRAAKQWDLIVVADGALLASIEFKSQVGPSFGNNVNNRVEEALGNATDLWTAYREGAFKESQRPWLGYFMLLEEAPGSVCPVKAEEPHFPVFPEFRDASYAKRYELLCHRLVRERLYDGVCLLLSSEKAGLRGEYREPSAEIGFEAFITALTARAIAYVQMKK